MNDMSQTGRKRVLVVINLFSSAANFVGGQFKYLSDQGYDMHLICSPDDRLHDFARAQGISYQPFPLNRQLTPVQDAKTLFHICRYIRRHKIDVIIGHQVKGRLLATLAGFLMRVPHVIIFAHGAIFETAKGLKRRLLLAESKLESLLSDKVVCVSTYIRDLRLKCHIDRPSQQLILGAGTCGGIDTVTRFNADLITDEECKQQKELYGITPEDFVVGFVGRLVKDKGIIELVEGFQKLKKLHPHLSFKLMIVGTPEKRDGLPAEVLEILQNSPDIIYTGQIPLDKMPLQYMCMKCLVLPSHREGFGFCNIEAQAMSIPVLTSEITGCRDSIINGKTGLYIDLSPEDIARKISVLTDESVRKAMGKEGIIWVRNNFDHTKVWPYVKSMLDSL